MHDFTHTWNVKTTKEQAQRQTTDWWLPEGKECQRKGELGKGDQLLWWVAKTVIPRGIEYGNNTISMFDVLLHTFQFLSLTEL